MSFAKFERYDAFKDSRVEWLGEVPAYWEVTRNKDIFEERGSLSISGDETLLTVSHITGVTRRTEKNVNMFMAETMEGYKLCKKSDLVINTMWAWMGALGTANEDGICSPAYGVYKPRKFQQYNHRYFDYLYRTPNAITEMTRRSKGIVSSRLRLYPRDFFQIKTTLPSEIEQTAIANYLDKKTTKIDRKIDLLSQKATKYGKLKQSLINEIVTHGLDKTVAMKDSGVEWIGKVPAHWDARRLKNIVGNFETGKLDVNAYDADGKYPFFTCSKTPTTINTYAFDKEALLIAGNGDVGSVTYFKGKFNAYQRTYIISQFKRIDVHFLKYIIESLLPRSLEEQKKGSVIEFIKLNHLRNFVVAFPLKQEQQDIADYLDDKTTHINSIVTTINTQIEKLKELRKTLINDVVTGKIKVVKEGQAA